MKKLIFGLILTLLLLCGSAEAINKGDVGYIEKGMWWTTSFRMLELIDAAIRIKDHTYLLYLIDKAYLNIQLVKIKVVVVTKIRNKVKVRIYGTGYTLWIWESFIN